jgi:hypothetical protein
VGIASRSWLPVAAYLYVLNLDGPSLAWEYLRRNTDYRRDCDRGERDPKYFAERWGLTFPENPDLDARTVQPVWRIAADTLVRVTGDDDDETGDADRFSLWAVPGRKSLCYDSRRLLLTVALGGRVLRMAIANNVCDGGSFAYVIGAGPRARAQWQAVQELRASSHAKESGNPPSVTVRPGRLALLHMRALQALDGVLAGASQREIAVAIFGEQRVTGCWHADSELRAQTRHLIRRGEAFMHGEYRSLVARGGGNAYGGQAH